MNKIIKIDKNNKYFNVSWKMTLWCNQKCSYCFQNHTKWREYAEICNVADKLNIILNTIDEDINLQFVGGEVTYYNLIDLLQNHLTSKNIKTISIVTNFSNTIDYFNDLNKYCKQNNISLSLVISYHPEYITIENLIDKISKLDSSIKISHINFVVTNENVNSLENIFNNIIVNKDLFFNNLQLIKDQKGIDPETNKIFNKLINTYQTQAPNWTVTFDNNVEKNLNRSNCQVLNQSYNGYMCDKILRLDLDNTFRAGVCGTNIKIPINEFIYKTKKDIKKFCLTKCILNKCPLCGFNLIYKEK